MSKFPHLPLFTDAFIADTTHLNATETGAYLLLLMTAWRSPDCRLPDDDKKLARWARVDPRAWHKLKPVVMEFWALTDGFWTQKRLLSERDSVSKRAETARLNGMHGGRPKSLINNDQENPAGSSRVSQEKASIPIPISKTPIAPKGKDAAAPLAAEADLDLFMDRLMAGEPVEPKRVSLKDIDPMQLYDALTKGTKPAPKPQPVAEPKPRAPKGQVDPQVEIDFAEFWSAYPSRGASGNPRKPAWEEYLKAIRKGADPAILLAAARALAAQWRKEPKDRWQYIPLASTWLHQERWTDTAVAKPDAKASEAVLDEKVLDSAVRQFHVYGRWPEKALGPAPGQPGCTIPRHILAKHGYAAAA
jgi:uncharacterized protein YdaU (DUF1376 family)